MHNVKEKAKIRKSKRKEEAGKTFVKKKRKRSVKKTKERKRQVVCRTHEKVEPKRTICFGKKIWKRNFYKS